MGTVKQRLIGLTIIGCGLSTAWTFYRLPHQPPLAPGDRSGQDLIWRRSEVTLQVQASADRSPAESLYAESLNSGQDDQQQSAVAEPRVRAHPSLEDVLVPPALAPSYHPLTNSTGGSAFRPLPHHDAEQPTALQRAAARQTRGSEAREDAATHLERSAMTIRHVIRDGDTLAGLAERLLGSPDRWTEIYAANRHLLDDPDLLPLGIEIVIVRSDPADATSQDASRRQREPSSQPSAASE